MRTGWMMAGVLLAATPGTGALAQPAPIPVATDGPVAEARTLQAIDLPGGRIRYRASWFEHVLRAPDGTARATISATSYVREGKPAVVRARPVLFAFNGGPGASSSPLHMNGIGPWRLGERGADGQRALVVNAETVLDVADLVFIDPVGTGFSRPLTPDGGAPYWSAEGDAAAAMDLVRAWLAREGRTGSPVWFAGESYGGYRLGLMARDMAGIDVKGLVLVSPALDFGTSADQDAIDRLPTMAVAAWLRSRADDDRRTAHEVWDEARRFAQGDYASALQAGNAIDPATEGRIAERIAALLAMTPEAVRTAKLRVDSQAFLEGLVDGQVVGRLDTRIAAPKPQRPLNPDRPAAANDPALGLGRSNVIVSEPIGRYLKQRIGVATSRDYYSLTLDVNFAWDFRPASPRPPLQPNVANHIGALMQARPEVKLLVYGGFYDLATPVLATAYSLSHSSVPPDRTTLAWLDTGHSVFEGESRPAAAAALRAFITGKKCTPGPDSAHKSC